MKSEAIDILKLYAEGDPKTWNAFLSRALARSDVSGLTDVLRRLQMGMDNLAVQKLNTEEISILFLRLQRSVENTLKEIHRAKNPNPLFTTSDPQLRSKHIADKQRKAHELELFLKKARY